MFILFYNSKFILHPQPCLDLGVLESVWELLILVKLKTFLLKVCRKKRKNKKLKADFWSNGTQLTVQWDPL